MDFFTSAHTVHTPSQDEHIDPFAAAIGRRFSTGTSSMLTSRFILDPPTPAQGPNSFSVPPATPSLLIPLPKTPTLSRKPSGTLKTPSNPLSQLTLKLTAPTTRRPRTAAPIMQSSQPSQEEFQRFTPIPADTLPEMMRSASNSSTPTPSSILILDIRNHHAFISARVRGAMNLSVPSTLLKRATFSLSKITDMLPSDADRLAFAAWRSAEQIIVCDQDSTSLSPGSNLLGLLRKFEIEGFTGTLGYIHGGFSAVWRTQREYVDESAPVEVVSEGQQNNTFLHSRHLPPSAFQQVSTTTAGKKSTNGSLALDDSAAPPSSQRVSAANPFYDNIRQNLELASGITERIPLKLPPRVMDRQHELPFEWLREIARKGAADNVINGSPNGESMQDLAMQFYRIELGEQRRLMGVMDHHSRECTTIVDAVGTQVEPPYFPFSITAGVEKGTKNRYKNIWPFEHARVRLQTPSVSDNSDYINASYIQPRGTTLKYIATQGPLATTYTDFWTLVWEQNVSIIVMLTKQMEGNSVKCGCYWDQEQYGHFKLQTIGVEGPIHVDQASSSSGGFNFSQPLAPGAASESRTKEPEERLIRRTFSLIHTGHPEAPPHKVVQMQYVGWPDLDVPESPARLLELIKEVNQLREEFGSHGFVAGKEHLPSRRNSADLGPVLVHCSAGVGRTGSFVMVDAVLDGIRREAHSVMQKARDTVSHPHPSNRDANHHTVKKRRSSSGNATELQELAIQGGSSSPPPVPPFPPAERKPLSLRNRLPSMRMTDSPGPMSNSSVAPSNGSTLPPAAPIHLTLPPAPHPGTPTLSPSRFTSNPVHHSSAGSSFNTAPSAFWDNRSVVSNNASLMSPYSSVDSQSMMDVKSTPPRPSLADESSHFKFSSTPITQPDPTANTNPYRHLNADGPRSTALSSVSSFNQPSEDESEQTHSRSPSPTMSATSAAMFQNTQSQSDAPTEKQPPRHALRHPSSNSSSAYDYMSPRWIKKPTSALKDDPAGPVPYRRMNPDGTVADDTASSPPTPPSPLSTFDEPIRQVLEDMREQRMSLCQSLRQYVFVHLAIVEGALDIVDEMKIEARVAPPLVRVHESADTDMYDVSDTVPPLSSEPRPSSSSRSPAGSKSRAMRSAASQLMSATTNMSQTLRDTLSPARFTSLGVSREDKAGKRRPTLTELVKQDSKGSPKLDKRPSIKRKARSDQSDASAQAQHYHDDDELEDADRMIVDGP